MFHGVEHCFRIATPAYFFLAAVDAATRVVRAPCGDRAVPPGSAAVRHAADNAACVSVARQEWVEKLRRVRKDWEAQPLHQRSHGFNVPRGWQRRVSQMPGAAPAPAPVSAKARPRSTHSAAGSPRTVAGSMVINQGTFKDFDIATMKSTLSVRRAAVVAMTMIRCGRSAGWRTRRHANRNACCVLGADDGGDGDDDDAACGPAYRVRRLHADAVPDTRMRRAAQSTTARTRIDDSTPTPSPSALPMYTGYAGRPAGRPRRAADADPRGGA